MKRIIFKRAVLGFILGIAVGFLIAFITSARTAGTMIVSDILVRRTGSVAGAFVIHALLSGLLGAVSMVGIGFYEIEDWGMTKSALLHFLSIIAVYIPIALICGWIRPALKQILIMTMIEAAAYFLVWLVMFLRYRKEAGDLNDLIRRRK